MSAISEASSSRLSLPQQCQEAPEGHQSRMSWSFWRDRFNKRQQLETQGFDNNWICLLNYTVL